jgi:hypothetical protein
MSARFTLSLRSKEPVTTLAKYDDMVRAQDKFSATNNTRPESSVVKTISE